MIFHAIYNQSFYKCSYGTQFFQHCCHTVLLQLTFCKRCYLHYPGFLCTYSNFPVLCAGLQILIIYTVGLLGPCSINNNSKARNSILIYLSNIFGKFNCFPCIFHCNAILCSTWAMWRDVRLFHHKLYIVIYTFLFEQTQLFLSKLPTQHHHHTLQYYWDCYIFVYSPHKFYV